MGNSELWDDETQQRLCNDVACKSGCGRPKFSRFPTCCTRCKGPEGPHNKDCLYKAGMVEPSGGASCSQGCGRSIGTDEDGVCCESCPYLKGKGHTAACDVRHNDGKAVPWYW